MLNDGAHRGRRAPKATTTHHPFAITLMCAAFGTHAQPVPSQAEWATLAADGSRTATRPTGAPDLDAVRWTLDQTAAGDPIRFVGPSSVAATVLPEPRLFTVADIDAQTYAISIDADTGQIEWITPLPALIYDSLSSPTITGNQVLYATGSSLIALRMSDGSEAWRTNLAAPTVNVTPVVTRDRRRRNRAFVTSYGGFGAPSWLYCINLSPRNPRLNPYDPGDIVWSAPIGSAAGATPTYMDGVVYVCSTGLDADGFGQIRAYDATATTTPAPLWTFTNPLREGFFGGLTIRESSAGPHLYAATYAFYGQTDSANLVKLNARTGELIWSVPSNRTESIPVVLEDGRIVLASGIQGFGSVPMVQMFQDHGTNAVELWNTATSTWTDANNNGSIDLGEFLLVGGWTTHPVLLSGRTPGTAPSLLVGSIPTQGDGLEPYTDLYELDLARSPGEPGFIAQHTTRAGSSPAMLGAGVYSFGPEGLAAIGPPPPRPDINADGRVDIEDLYAWTQTQGDQDIDRNGIVDHADRAFLLFELRRNERRDASAGRR